MGAHWEATGDRIMVSGNPSPPKQPVSWVDPAKYRDFDLNADVAFAPKVQKLLQGAGFNVSLNENFEQIHDTL